MEIKFSELQEGQSFEFGDRFFGRSFKVIEVKKAFLIIKDEDTGEVKTIKSKHKPFRSNVHVDVKRSSGKVVSFTDEEVEILEDILQYHYRFSAEDEKTHYKMTHINKMLRKINK